MFRLSHTTKSAQTEYGDKGIAYVTGDFKLIVPVIWLIKRFNCTSVSCDKVLSSENVLYFPIMNLLHCIKCCE